MSSTLSSLVIGAAAGALLGAGLHALHNVLRAPLLRDRPKRGRKSRRRSAPAADGSDPAAPEADPPPEHDQHDAPAPSLGRSDDPRALEDTARRTIAYLLIAMLAVYVASVQAMVIFGVIEVEDVKEFNVILGPFVTLVTAAISFYYGRRR